MKALGILLRAGLLRQRGAKARVVVLGSFVGPSRISGLPLPFEIPGVRAVGIDPRVGSGGLLHIVGGMAVKIVGVRLSLFGFLAEPFGVDHGLLGLRFGPGRLDLGFSGIQRSFFGLLPQVGSSSLILGPPGTFVLLPAFAREEKCHAENDK